MHIVDCTTDWSVIGEPTARREWELGGGGGERGKGRGGCFSSYIRHLAILYNEFTQKSAIL